MRELRFGSYGMEVNSLALYERSVEWRGGQNGLVAAIAEAKRETEIRVQIAE